MTAQKIISLVLVLVITTVTIGTTNTVTYASETAPMMPTQEALVESGTYIETLNRDIQVPLDYAISNLGGKVTYSTSLGLTHILLNKKVITYNNKLNTLISGNLSFPSNGQVSVVDGQTYLSLNVLNTYWGVKFAYVETGILLSFQYGSDWHETKPTFIAHAGGEWQGLMVSNALEAIESSIEYGTYIIELDFLKSRDGHYVLAHDWGSVRNLFSYMGGSLPLLEQFMAAESKYGLTPLDLDGLVALLMKYPKLKIVTDTKNNNIDLLKYISDHYPEYQNRFYPQVFNEDQYLMAKKLGYKTIIYSLYVYYRSDASILEFARTHELYAVTMAEERVYSGLAQKLSNLGITTYVHTINAFDTVFKLKNLGVYGFYTDILHQK
jgi:glycerophosphoryl diester phosphodiesterase